jgi:hypothetical protein
MTLPIIFSAASLIFCGFFFIYFRAYLRRRIGREEIFSDYRDEVEKLAADIDAAAERDLTLIEDRLKTLKEIIDTADRRIAVLVRELDRQKTSGGLYTSLGKRAENKPGSSAPQEQHAPEPAFAGEARGGLVDSAVPAAETPAMETDAGRIVPEAGPAGPAPGIAGAGTAPAVRAVPAETPGRPEFPDSPTAKSIGEKAVELAGAGFSPELIAARLGISVSEVDLAITIHRR